jgi:hypothetical protein
MLYTGTCRKQEFFNVLIDKILNSGVYSQLSKNIVQDGKREGSDGYVFQSNLLQSEKKLTFGLKDFNSSSSNTQVECSVRTTESYIAGESEGDNGTWGEGTGWRSYYFTYEHSVCHDTEIQYWIDILPHRIIIVSQKHHFGAEHPSLLYIGYPELHSQISIHLMDNNMLIGNNIQLSNGSGNIDVLTGLDGAHNQHQKLYSLLPPRNPNIAGEYQLSPIYIGYADTGFIGKLEGLWAMPDENINNNDEIDVNGDRYKVFKLNNNHNHSSFTTISKTFAIKVV